VGLVGPEPREEAAGRTQASNEEIVEGAFEAEAGPAGGLKADEMDEVHFMCEGIAASVQEAASVDPGRGLGAGIGEMGGVGAAMEAVAEGAGGPGRLHPGGFGGEEEGEREEQDLELAERVGGATAEVGGKGLEGPGRIGGTAGQADEDAEGEEVDEERGAAVADERQGDAGQGPEAEVAADAEGGLDGEEANDAGEERFLESVLSLHGEREPGSDEREDDGEEGGAAEPAELLGDGGEGEVGLDGGDVAGPSAAEAGAGDAAGADRPGGARHMLAALEEAVGVVGGGLPGVSPDADPVVPAGGGADGVAAREQEEEEGEPGGGLAAVALGEEEEQEHDGEQEHGAEVAHEGEGGEHEGEGAHHPAVALEPGPEPDHPRVAPGGQERAAQGRCGGAAEGGWIGAGGDEEDEEELDELDGLEDADGSAEPEAMAGVEVGAEGGEPGEEEEPDTGGDAEPSAAGDGAAEARPAPGDAGRGPDHGHAGEEEPGVFGGEVVRAAPDVGGEAPDEEPAERGEPAGGEEHGAEGGLRGGRCVVRGGGLPGQEPDGEHPEPQEERGEEGGEEPCPLSVVAVLHGEADGFGGFGLARGGEGAEAPGADGGGDGGVEVRGARGGGEAHLLDAAAWLELEVELKG